MSLRATLLSARNVLSYCFAVRGDVFPSFSVMKRFANPARTLDCHQPFFEMSEPPRTTLGAQHVGEFRGRIAVATSIPTDSASRGTGQR